MKTDYTSLWVTNLLEKFIIKDLLDEKMELGLNEIGGSKVQILPLLLSNFVKKSTLKNEVFCPNEVIHYSINEFLDSSNENLHNINFTWNDTIYDVTAGIVILVQE